MPAVALGYRLRWKVRSSYQMFAPLAMPHARGGSLIVTKVHPRWGNPALRRIKTPLLSSPSSLFSFLLHPNSHHAVSIKSFVVPSPRFLYLNNADID